MLDRDRFVVGGPSDSGGVVVDWLHRDILADTESIGDLLDKAEHVNTSDLLCLPYLSGERAPPWNESVSGAFV